MLLEVCVDSIESALAAAEGGSRRIELCNALAEGGLTPTPGMLTVVKKKLHSKYPDLKIFCMIRPRRGDFLYSHDELDSMVMDIHVLKETASDGFVFGCLNADGTLDGEANKRLLKAADSLPCTLHRAFDVCKEPLVQAEIAMQLGFKRILTSGQQKSALEGVELLKLLRQKFSSGLVIMAGVGINEKNATEIVQKTGVEEIHSSASVPKQSKMVFRNSTVTMSSSSTDEFATKGTDASKVREILNAALSVQKVR